MVPSPPTSPPSVTPSTSGQSPPRTIATINDVLTLDRMAFLRLAMSGLELSQTSITNLNLAHRTSTCRQYQSGWRKFQGFISTHGIKSISPSVLTDFATSTFHAGPRVSPATVSNAMVAIRDPMFFGFGVTIDQRQWELLKAAFFQQRPPPVPQPPQWSLNKVLALLGTTRFQSDPTPYDLLLRTLFLVAMATGHRVSQMAALSRAPEFTRFAPGDTSVTLHTSPRFWQKMSG